MPAIFTGGRPRGAPAAACSSRVGPHRREGRPQLARGGTWRAGSTSPRTRSALLPSKEEFAYSIVKANRRAVMDLFEELCGGRRAASSGRDAMRVTSDRRGTAIATSTATPPPRTSPPLPALARRAQRRSRRSIASRWAGSWSGLRAWCPGCGLARWRTSRWASRLRCLTGAPHARGGPGRRRRRRHRLHLRRAVRPKYKPPAAPVMSAAGARNVTPRALRSRGSRRSARR